MQNNNNFSTLVKEIHVFSKKEACQINSLKCFLYIIFHEPSLFISHYFINKDISLDNFFSLIEKLDINIPLQNEADTNILCQNSKDYLSSVFIKCGSDLNGDIRKEHLLNHLLKNSLNFREFCSQFINCEDFINFLDKVEVAFKGGKEAIDSLSSNSDLPKIDFSNGGVKFCEKDFVQEDNDVLSYFSNITDEVKEYPHHPAIGRDKEIFKVVHILNKKNKPNCILIGEAGVGKSAIVEGLAYNIANHIGENGILEGREIYSLNICQLLAGTAYRGQAEERISKILYYFESRDDIILFIDEIHMIVGAGGKSSNDSCDLSNILKPYLSRGKITCIGATTLHEYHDYISPDSALERRFSLVSVEEPAIDDVKVILNGVRKKFEEYHGIKYGKNTIKNVIAICEEFYQNKKYPDKAIDILDSYGSYLKLHSFVANKKSFASFCLFYIILTKSDSSLGFSTNTEESLESKINRLVL